MRTAGRTRRKRTTRTHSSTWMSLCFRRAQATCYQPSASLPFSTRSSHWCVWSDTTASRYAVTRCTISHLLPESRYKPTVGCLMFRCLWWCSRERRRLPESLSLMVSTSLNNLLTTTSKANGIVWSSTRRELLG